MMDYLFSTYNELTSQLKVTDQVTWVFIILSIVILGTIQFYVIKFRYPFQVLGIVAIHIFFGILLAKCSVYALRVHLLLYIVPSFIITGIIGVFPKFSSNKIQEAIFFEYETNQGKIQLTNPFRGICIFGGAGSGKTLSLIKPTIEQMAQKKFSGIIYDYKRFDLSRCAYQHYKDSGINFRLVNFFELEYSHRVNPILPELLENPAFANEAASVLFTNLSRDGHKNSNESYFSEAAEAALSSVIWRLKEDFPEDCNLPIAISICLNQDYNRIASFISRNRQAALTGSTYIQSLVNPKQAVGVISTVSSALRKLAIPEIYYVLSGNDFSLDLNNPDSPSILCISNHQKLDKSFSPVIALLINMAIKQLNNEGKQQSAILLDEAATLRIPGMDNVPATSRENKIVSIICFQDLAQGEDLYGRIGRDKLVANLANQFYGRVTEPTTAERYSKMFGKVDRPYTSKTHKSWGWSTTSYTTSLRDIDLYKPQLFLHLKPGEFYGILAQGKKKQFNAIFKMHTYPYVTLPIVNNVSEVDIKDNFEKIIEKANQLIDS